MSAELFNAGGSARMRRPAGVRRCMPDPAICSCHFTHCASFPPSSAVQRRANLLSFTSSTAYRFFHIEFLTISFAYAAELTVIGEIVQPPTGLAHQPATFDQPILAVHAPSYARTRGARGESFEKRFSFARRLWGAAAPTGAYHRFQWKFQASARSTDTREGRTFLIRSPRRTA